MAVKHMAAEILLAAIRNDEEEGKRLIAQLSVEGQAQLGFHLLRVQHWLNEIEWREEAPTQAVCGSDDLLPESKES